MPGQPDKVVLQDISFQVRRGEVLCILGANGIGKTTLFKSILGAIPLLGGSILLDGQDMGRLSKQEVARKIGYVPQSHIPPFPFTVLQIVVMGRASHLSLFANPGEKDYQIGRDALELLGIVHLAEDIYTEISGGERQLALIARALAQQADLLIMDEPTSNLDFGNQIRVLRQIHQLAQSGIGVILTTHYPNQAFLCASSVAVIKGRQDFVFGGVEEIVTRQLLEEIYGIHVSLVTTESPAGTPVKSVIPYL
ncbi:iron ABC transporter ATP-binding protein [Candidatus Formimonas warabiya]|uniref:Iron ABC transporter ATP-binding protein n=2 Tax=Formimonas warabiya TaxID=1761012 RepID=A0A3G1L1R2_FORW1|nr:ABC transporter ATP-binding protein [Candidatus Formimonas warabiya]ATW28597.1 iron ABC transporter ATP-binding protein [Candidatus Formimonas warabiya]